MTGKPNRKTVPAVVALRVLAALYRFGRPASAPEVRSQIALRFPGVDREPSHDIAALERQGLVRLVETVTVPKYWTPTPAAFPELKRAANYFRELAEFLDPNT